MLTIETGKLNWSTSLRAEFPFSLHGNLKEWHLWMTRKILLVKHKSILGQGRRDVEDIPPTNYFYICADNSHSPVAWNPGQTQYALKTRPYTYHHIEAKLFHEQYVMQIFYNIQ